MASDTPSLTQLRAELSKYDKNAFKYTRADVKTHKTLREFIEEKIKVFKDNNIEPLPKPTTTISTINLDYYAKPLCILKPLEVSHEKHLNARMEGFYKFKEFTNDIRTTSDFNQFLKDVQANDPKSENGYIPFVRLTDDNKAIKAFDKKRFQRFSTCYDRAIILFTPTAVLKIPEYKLLFKMTPEELQRKLKEFIDNDRLCCGVCFSKIKTMMLPCECNFVMCFDCHCQYNRHLHEERFTPKSCPNCRSDKFREYERRIMYTPLDKNKARCEKN
jgi:hypothetical protein